MGLFAGQDVETKPSLWSNQWLLALLVADLPVDAAIGLIVGMPRLEAALTGTGLAMPAATLFLIRLGTALATKWWIILPPIAVTPLLIAWRWRENAAPWLQAAFITELALFAALCLSILLPIKTILDAS